MDSVFTSPYCLRGKKSIIEIKNDKIADLCARLKAAEEQADYWRGRFDGMKIEFQTLQEQIRQLSIENVKLLNQKGRPNGLRNYREGEG